MSDNKKSKVIGGSVSKKSTDIQSLSDGPIPLGELWVATEFGACDINIGDNLSSLYKIKWGDDLVDGAIISVTGNTVVLKDRWEFIGDGLKELKIERTNSSNNDKELPFWVKLYKRS